MTYVDTVIDKLGGPDVTASKTGVGYSAIRKWSKNGIPPKYWPLIVSCTDETFSALEQAYAALNPGAIYLPTARRKKSASSRKPRA